MGVESKKLYRVSNSFDNKQDKVTGFDFLKERNLLKSHLLTDEEIDVIRIQSYSPSF